MGSDDDVIGYWSASRANGDINEVAYNEEEHVETGAGYANEQMISEGSSSQETGEEARTSSLSGSKQKSKKRCSSDGMVEMMRDMARNIGRIADALTEHNNNNEAGGVCLDEVFEMVQNIPGFDDDLIIEACEFLSFDEKRAKMFLKLDERLRRLWLIKRLRGNSG